MMMITVVKEGDVIAVDAPGTSPGVETRYYILDGRGRLKEVQWHEASDYQNKVRMAKNPGRGSL